MFLRKKSRGKGFIIALVFTFLFQFMGLTAPQTASAATTGLTITKYAVDGKTILEQRTVDYHWLMDPDNIDVMGDGETRYYHQGPVFIDDPDEETQELLRWNEAEDTNWDTKDMGALKGTNVKDLCNLVGGMKIGDELKIKALDGVYKTFAYKNVYNYSDREGPMVICWYQDGKYPDTGYTDGMRLVWFAGATEKKNGPKGLGDYHVFGNWDWHEAADEEYWYYTFQNGKWYPTTTGLSVYNVAELNILTDEEAPECPVTLIADTTNNQLGQTIDITFADDPDWRDAIIGIKVGATALSTDKYSVTAGNINIAASVFTQAKDYNITIQTIGYKEASVTQSILAADTVPLAIVVKENGTELQTINYNLNDWELERQYYSIKDSSGKYRFGAAEGVYLEDILNDAEIDIETINNLKFISNEDPPYIANLTSNELLNAQRYYYPNIFSENKEDGAQVVKPMLAVKSYVGDRDVSTLPSWDSTDDENTIRLFFGQKNVDDVNYSSFAKLVCRIEVEATETSGPVAVTGVSITEGDQELDVDETVQLNAVVAPENATNKNVSWSSSNDNVASVSTTGLVTAVAVGTADITVTTEDGSKTDSITVIVAEGSGGPTIDVLFEGTVSLTPNETFTVTVGTNQYTINENTPLGALQAAAEANSFTYVLSDKRWSYDQVLLLDDVGEYVRKSPGYWYAYVNDVYKDGYQNNPDGLNVIELVDGDQVEFYYAADISDATDLNAVKAAATAAVKTIASIEVPSTMDVLYEGTVSLTPDETFTVTVGTNQYTIDENTPLGALHAASVANDFTYVASDKKWGESGILLLDDIGDYPYVKNDSQWRAYVNDVFKDGFADADDALNVVELFEGDKVEFYYANIDSSDLNAVKAAATAAVKTVAATGVTPTEWTLQLSGARDENVTRAYFEDGLACASSSHHVTWTDSEGNVWGGVPLWLLVGMVDDNPDIGNKHFNFNDELAALDYEIKIIGGDGWSTTLSSKDIAGSDAYIVANTLNEEPLPLKTDAGKGSWPLHLKGAAIGGGQQVGNIVRIELSGLPEPQAGWTLELIGDIGDTITQEEFEDGIDCVHNVKWTDIEENEWSGIPLWVLLGAVDDIEQTGNHWTFNADLAADYTVKLVAGDGFNKTLAGADVANSNDYIVANKYKGEPLAGAQAPLRLVGAGVTKADGSLSGTSVGNLVRIEIPELQTPEPAAGSWNLSLKGKITDVMPQAEFEAGVNCPNSGHQVEWTDKDGNIWSGMPLWLLAGWVDDRKPHGYDFVQAVEGYKVIVKASDGYSYDFDSQEINKNSNYIIANKCNGEPLTGKSAPLRLVGSGVANADNTLGGKSIGGIAEIKLTSFATGGSGVVPELRIVKYGEDGVTIVDEVTIDYLEMMERFDTIGDGETVYKYEGVTFTPDDIWGVDETYPGGFKIVNAIKGTKVRDLVGLVDGMGTGTEIDFVAKDGWVTTMPYSSIYPDPAVMERQGEAVIAWYADGKYVPDYKDGMRLFFTPEDLIYSQWDMHESLPEPYWHFYGDGDIRYPSCAGVSPKYITELRVFSVPAGDWTLDLDGLELGGLHEVISKNYFADALTCTFGADHRQTYTDSKGRVWSGMPLWLLAGFVDDQDPHSKNGAFNEGLATAGYQLVITAGDGKTVTINSQDIIRNNNYIVANAMDDIILADDDKNWPLRLVGPSVSGSDSIGNIVSIKLQNTAGSLTPPALTADSSDNRIGREIEITFTDDAAWRAAITNVVVDGLNVAGTRYTVAAGKITIADNVFTEAKTYNVAVQAEGYEDAEIQQNIGSDRPVYIVGPVTDPAYTIGQTLAGIKTMTVNAGISGFNYFTVDIEAAASHSGLETAVFTHMRNGSQLQINSTRADFDQVGTAQAGFNVKAGDVIRVYIVDALTNAADHNPVILQ